MNNFLPSLQTTTSTTTTPFDKPEQQHWLRKCCICMFYNQCPCWILLQHKIIKSSFIVFSLLLILLFACRFKLNKDSNLIFSTMDDQAGLWMETTKMTMMNETAPTSSLMSHCLRGGSLVLSHSSGPPMWRPHLCLMPPPMPSMQPTSLCKQLPLCLFNYNKHATSWQFYMFEGQPHCWRGFKT